MPQCPMCVTGAVVPKPTAAAYPNGEPLAINTGGIEYLDRAVSLLTDAFLVDPVYNYLLYDFPSDKHGAYLKKLMHALIKACVLNEGKIIEIAEPGSCTVLMPPGRRADGSVVKMIRAGLVRLAFLLGVPGCKRIIGEYPSKAEVAKSKGLSLEEKKGGYWYIFITATAEERRGQGLASKAVRHLQDIATNDGRPIWLEATTEASHRLYSRLGFEDVDGGDIHLGQGVVGPDGRAKTDGEGVTIWAMVWRPKKAT